MQKSGTKKMAHYEFETPKIIGVISDRTVPATLKKKLDAAVSRQKAGYVCLPFKVESKYLKNVVACMRLMDIEGLIVVGDHEKRIAKFVPLSHPAAKKLKRTNVVKRTKNTFRGYYIEYSKNFYKEAVKLLTSRRPASAL